MAIYRQLPGVPAEANSFLVAGELINQVSSKIGHLAQTHGRAPFIQTPKITLPKVSAEREVLQHDIGLALLE
jgi:hypothetical protein